MVDSKLSERIKHAMEKIGLKSNIDLANRAEVSEASLYRWLRDEEIPRGSSRYKLAKALGVDPEWLRTGEGSMEPQAAPNPYAWLEQLAPTHDGKLLLNEGIVNLVIDASQHVAAFCAETGLQLDSEQRNLIVRTMVQRCIDEQVLPERQHVADALAQLIHPR